MELEVEYFENVPALQVWVRSKMKERKLQTGHIISITPLNDKIVLFYWRGPSSGRI
jgi:hypothetical protein